MIKTTLNYGECTNYINSINLSDDIYCHCFFYRKKSRKALYV